MFLFLHVAMFELKG